MSQCHMSTLITYFFRLKKPNPLLYTLERRKITVCVLVCVCFHFESVKKLFLPAQAALTESICTDGKKDRSRCVWERARACACTLSFLSSD